MDFGETTTLIILWVLIAFALFIIIMAFIVMLVSKNNDTYNDNSKNTEQMFLEYANMINVLRHFENVKFSFLSKKDWKRLKKEIIERKYWNHSSKKRKRCILLLQIILKDLYESYPDDPQDMVKYLKKNAGEETYSLDGDVYYFILHIGEDKELARLYQRFIDRIQGIEANGLDFYIETIKDIEKNGKGIQIQFSVTYGNDNNGYDDEKEIDDDGAQRENPDEDLWKKGCDLCREIKHKGNSCSGKVSTEIVGIVDLLNKILYRVQIHMEQIDKIRKLVNYYLPTTIKLLDRYAELRTYQVDGENINIPKQKIEEALKDISQALEKMLNGLCQDTAWDVDADISVLKTMIEQDGFSDNGIK